MPAFARQRAVHAAPELQIKGLSCDVACGNFVPYLKEISDWSVAILSGEDNCQYARWK